MTHCKRLHISPLNPQLLPTILPGTLLDEASNISFHTIETFPERNYCYVELPEAKADKLRRKLHGSTLRGSKMRVDEARPKKALKEKQAQEETLPDVKAPKERRTKAMEKGVIPGRELQDRKVKRGWTEPSSDSKSSKRHKDQGDKKSKAKPSSLTGEAECLFKATLPPNTATSGDSRVGKVKKRKRGESSRDVVVHEFSNTTKHANFLRDASDAEGKKSASEFVEGKGWVDEDGNIVEAGPKRRRSKAKPIEESKLSAHDVGNPRSRRSSRLEVPSVRVTGPKTRGAPTAVADDETSSSGTSSSENGGEADPPEPSPPARRGSSTPRQIKGAKLTNNGGLGHGEDEVNRIERLSITQSSATPPATQEPAPTSAPSTKEVHPLEALFKRPNTAASHTPKKPNLEVTTSFSFFDPDVEEEGSQGLLMPQTPFTQQDIRQRRQRSAAPTPDTAAPGKTFGDVWEGTSDNSGSDDEMEEHTPASKGNSATPDIKEEKPESDFSKWFWEHRGENNRAWKRRRREAAKEKRQKDNKERRG